MASREYKAERCSLTLVSEYQYLSSSGVSRMLPLSFPVDNKTFDSEDTYVGWCHYIRFLSTKSIFVTWKKSEGRQLCGLNVSFFFPPNPSNQPPQQLQLNKLIAQI